MLLTCQEMMVMPLLKVLASLLDLKQVHVETNDGHFSFASRVTNVDSYWPEYVNYFVTPPILHVKVNLP